MKWKELLKNVPRVTPNYNRLGTSVVKMDVNYDLDNKTLNFYGTVRSISRHGNYSVIITFTKIDPDEGLSADEVLNGYMPKPNLAKHDIKVRCSCPTQRFRFDTPDRANLAGAGKPFGIYHRKTNRKPNNPENLPGVCYHIIEFVDYLKSKGFLH